MNTTFKYVCYVIIIADTYSSMEIKNWERHCSCPLVLVLVYLSPPPPSPTYISCFVFPFVFIVFCWWRGGGGLCEQTWFFFFFGVCNASKERGGIVTEQLGTKETPLHPKQKSSQVSKKRGFIFSKGGACLRWTGLLFSTLLFFCPDQAVRVCSEDVADLRGL